MSFEIKKSLAVTAALWALLDQAQAVMIEPLPKALVTLMKTTKVSKKPVAGSKEGAELYFSKNGGKIVGAAFVEHGIYPPDCTHTWAIGINPANGSVTEVRPVEMKCQHAFPTKAASFLDQFKGAGPKDLAKLDKIDTVAKATGSCILAKDAVKRSIINWNKMKGQL